MLAVVQQGRHRYYRLVDPEVAAVLERLMGLAASRASRVYGPRDPALREARVCFDHLAGAVAVRLTDAFRRNGFIGGSDGWIISEPGVRFFETLHIDVPSLQMNRRPLLRECLDWSERRFHIGGALGAALLERLFASGWAIREPGSRIITFTDGGKRWLHKVVRHALPGNGANW